MTFFRLKLSRFIHGEWNFEEWGIWRKHWADTTIKIELTRIHAPNLGERQIFPCQREGCMRHTCIK